MTQPTAEEKGLIQLQPALINKLAKQVIPDKVITSDFKRQFSKALSIFVLYVQSGQAKKKYNKSDVIQFMEREGLGRVAQDLRLGKQGATTQLQSNNKDKDKESRKKAVGEEVLA